MVKKISATTISQLRPCYMWRLVHNVNAISKAGFTFCSPPTVRLAPKFFASHREAGPSRAKRWPSKSGTNSNLNVGVKKRLRRRLWRRPTSFSEIAIFCDVVKSTASLWPFDSCRRRRTDGSQLLKKASPECQKFLPLTLQQQLKVIFGLALPNCPN